MRSLLGISVAGAALLEQGHAASASPQTSVRGPAGPEGLDVKAAKKKRGKRGPTGPTGPAGVTLTRDSEDFPIPVGSNGNGQVNCPSGEVTGGGAGLSNVACELVSSGPVGATAWAATAKCPPGQSATMTVTVICLA